MIIGKKLSNKDTHTPLLDSSLTVVATLCSFAKSVTWLSVVSFGKIIVVKCVVFVSVDPKIASPPLLETVCCSLYSPEILYTPFAGCTSNSLILPACNCSVNFVYSISDDRWPLLPKIKYTTITIAKITRT